MRGQFLEYILTGYNNTCMQNREKTFFKHSKRCRRAQRSSSSYGK